MHERSNRPGLGSAEISVPVRNSEYTGSLSFGQERLWFLDQLSPGNTFYNDCTVFRFRGPLDTDALCRGLRRVLERHKVLRTAYPATNGHPSLHVLPASEVEIRTLDVGRVAQGERQGEIERRVQEDLLRPIRIVAEAPLRLLLLRFDAVDHALILTIHHIAFDAWSLGVLCRELEVLYCAFAAGDEDRLPDLPLQYSDFAAWQRERVARLMPDQLPFWRERLSSGGFSDTFPPDRPRPARQSFRGSSHPVELSPGLTAAVKLLSRREGVTPFVILLTVFELLLGHRSALDDVRVGTAVAGRRHTKLEDLIGFFVNTVVLRSDLSGDPTMDQLLARVANDSTNAMSHQDVPFEQIVDAVAPDRDSDRNPLFQVWFNLVSTPAPQMQLPGLEVTIADAATRTARLELALILWEREGRIAGRFEFADDLYERATIEQLGDQFVRLLTAAVSEPDAPVSTLVAKLGGAAGKRSGPAVVSDRARPEPLRAVAATVLDHFAESTRRVPSSVAVACGGVELTYAELDRRADGLALELRSRGAGPDALVAVSIERSVELLVAILGTLKAGAAYLPLDPGYPRSHLASVLEAARPSILVSRRSSRGRLTAFGGPMVDIDSVPARDVLGDVGSAWCPAPDDLAYVIYTSGSAGRPKGVLVSHRNLVSSTTARREVYRAPVARYLLASPCSFDSSVAGIFWTLMDGGTLILPTEPVARDIDALAGLIQTGRVTHTLMVPSLYDSLLDLSPQGALDSLRTVVVAGEACPPSLGKRHHQELPGSVLVNEYGPTEATVWATMYAIDRPVGEGLVPIGQPVPGVSVYLLDTDGQPVPRGHRGEIHIGGPGVARGYLGQADLTAERFVPDPFGARPGERLFRTGDFARARSDGSLEFLGRRDQQVKVRGFRVELGEVEGHLAAHPDVRQAVVLDADDGHGVRQLVAYLVVDAEAALTVDDLRSFLGSRLPAHMIPADFVMLERLPLTPNGKVDRDALPSAELSRRRLDGTYVAPSSPLERYLAEQWSEVLAVRPVGVHDRFFSIGGNSLKAAIMVNRVRDELGEVLEVATVFQYPSIAKMAKHLVERHSGLGGALKSIETGSADAVLGPIEGTAPQPDAPPRLLREMSDDDVRAELERRLARGSERE